MIPTMACLICNRLVATGGVCPSCASPEDEEFNRVEMESRIKQEYIRSMNDKPNMDDYIKLMEELSIARMLIRELGDRLSKLEKGKEPLTCPICNATAYPYPKCGCVYYKEKNT